VIYLWFDRLATRLTVQSIDIGRTSEIGNA